MFARAIAALLVLVLVGPSVVTATCELTCAMASHHEMARHDHGTPSSPAASCHEHQGSTRGVGLGATPSSLCHESAELPSAVVEAWFNTVLATAVPAPTVVITPLVTKGTIAHAHERSAPFDPRPVHRPLRV
jgi:hypothetical protein